MDKRTQISRWLSDLPFLVAAIFFIYLIFFIEHSYRKKNSSKELTEHFQKVLRKKEAEAEKILDKIIKAKVVTENTETLKGHQKFPGLDIPDWVSVQIYKGDTIVFWSDNIVPAKKIAKKEGMGYERIIRTGNGWYQLKIVKRDDMIIQEMILLKHEYSVQNKFLSNQFQEDFKIPSTVSISLANNGNKIFSSEGKFLFSLVFPKERFASDKDSPLQETLMLLCFIIAISLLVVFLKRVYDKFSFLILSNGWRFVLFTADVIILRLIQFYFRIPGPLYDSELFGPALYSSSAFFPSIGDLVINITLLVLLSFIFSREMTPVSFREKRGSSKIVAVAIPMLFIPSGLAAGGFFLYDFIINSSFPLNLQDVSGLNWKSIYGLLIIWGTWASLFLVLTGILKKSGFLSGTGSGENPRPAAIFISLIFFAAITTVISNYSNDYKEREKRKILAVKLTSTRNPVTEILFSQLEKQILSDKRVTDIAEETIHDVNEEFQNDSIGKIIRSHMTNEYWAKFNLQITLCSKNKKLRVQPQGYLVGCEDYFAKVIRDYGFKTLSEHLFFLDLGFGYENYLAVLPLPVLVDGKESVINLYLEITSMYIYKDLGYPELLINKNGSDFPDISDYSCGFYKDGKLFHRIGKYAFCFDLEHYLDNSNSEAFFAFDEMNHYHFRINQANDLIISKKQENFLTIISPFSYLFLFMGLATMMFIVVIKLPAIRGFSLSSLRLRLQTATMVILLISFIIIGLVVTVNIVRLTSNKNADYLNEKTMSIFVEFQHKFGNTDNLTESGREELENLLVKLSNVFFTDINIYNSYGQIVASSRPQVFDECLVSSQIDPEAYWNLKHEKSSIFIHQEKIGSYSYSSTYIPFYNDRNVLLGYINLPFFSRQDEIKKEISSFLVAFINVYLLLILIGILVAYFVSNYITAPLQLLASKIGHLKLGAINEKIQWGRKDEIGKLVDEYNRMIEELGESVDKLTKSEREGAWREMAKQVAHEIKNPLTPMKLSVQYLQKAWDEKTPDWEKRLAKFTRTLTDQIEALSVIATEFSDFAKLPLPVIEKIDISEVIEASLGIYQNQEKIDFKTEYPRERPFISGDRKQLMRLFTNLFNNSIEAIGKEKKGEICIGIERRDGMWTIEITDSGGGITSDQAEKIFQPYFTTKSGGTGLGLAIVKGILQSMNGSITFKSDPERGTTFVIGLPAYTE